MLFEPEYVCTMVFQSPSHSELLGVKPTRALREEISVLTNQNVFIEEKGHFLKFSSKGVEYETACSQLALIKDFVINHVNVRIPLYVKGLRRESEFLGAFFSALLEQKLLIVEEVKFRPDSDKQFHELMRRKISVDAILDDPSSLGFKIVSDVEIIEPSELYFDITKKFSFITLFLVYSALISFLAGYFKLTLKIRKRFHDDTR